MIYPDRDLQELYISHRSVWEEVWAGETRVEAALLYMDLEPDTDLWDRMERALKSHTDPL